MATEVRCHGASTWTIRQLCWHKNPSKTYFKKPSSHIWHRHFTNQACNTSKHSLSWCVNPPTLCSCREQKDRKQSYAGPGVPFQGSSPPPCLPFWAWLHPEDRARANGPQWSSSGIGLDRISQLEGKWTCSPNSWPFQGWLQVKGCHWGHCSNASLTLMGLGHWPPLEATCSSVWPPFLMSGLNLPQSSFQQFPCAFTEYQGEENYLLSHTGGQGEWKDKL